MEKNAAYQKIASINAVEGFDPESLAVEYSDLNTGESRKRLPVMAQLAWFRLRYPEGRIALTVQPLKDAFLATARIYPRYDTPVDCFLAEASATRGRVEDKPTISPREWAQTAAVGNALRYAGFGLQFHAAGDNFESPAVDELGETKKEAASADVPDAPATEIAVEPEAPVDPLTAAMLMPCPLPKYRGKMLGDLVTADPACLVWISQKYSTDDEIREAAKLICEHSLAQAG